MVDTRRAATGVAREHPTSSCAEQDRSTDHRVEDDAVRGLPASAADTGASECHHWRALHI